MIEVLAIGLSPVIFLFSWVYLRDKNNKEPFLLLALVFILGAATVIPAIPIEQKITEMLQASPGRDMMAAFFYAFVVAALTEEMLKYFVLRVVAYGRQSFDEPYDGIMYAVAASLGFAAAENLLYIMSFGIQTGVLRMFTAVPGHMMFGVLMGYFVGMAKFKPGRSRGLLLHLVGILAAVTVHGLYDFFLMWNEYAIAYLAIAVLIVGIILARRAMVIHREYKHGAS